MHHRIMFLLIVDTCWDGPPTPLTGPASPAGACAIGAPAGTPRPAARPTPGPPATPASGTRAMPVCHTHTAKTRHSLHSQQAIQAFSPLLPLAC